MSGQWPRAGRALLLFATMFIVAAASIEATRGVLQIAPFWPANALALVVLLRLRLHDAPFVAYGAIWTAGFLANLVCGTPLVASIWFSVGNALEVAIAHRVLRWGSQPMGRIAVVVMLQRLLPAAMVAPAAGGLVGVLGLQPAGLAEAGALWVHWWLPGALGLMIVTPFGLLISRHRLATLMDRGSWRDIAICVLGVCLVVMAVATIHRLAMLPLAILVTVFAAVRLRAAGVALVVGILAALIAPFVGDANFSAIDDPAQRLTLVQIFLVADGLAGMTIAALLDERDALVERLRAERKQASEAADQRMRLLTNVSHEIRTPLNAIQGCADLLVSAGPLNERQRDLAGAVSGASRQLHELASELLDSAKFDHGVPVSPTSIDARAIVEEAISALRAASASARRASIRINVYGPIWADPQRFAQVVTNLVSNAIKYASEYGAIEVRVIERDAAALLEVVDRGPGFSSVGGDLFEPFAKRHPGAESTGVGLSIVKQIVEAHGGAVVVTSAPFVETRISASFPHQGVVSLQQPSADATVDPDEMF